MRDEQLIMNSNYVITIGNISKYNLLNRQDMVKYNCRYTIIPQKNNKVCGSSGNSNDGKLYTSI